MSRLDAVMSACLDPACELPLAPWEVVTPRRACGPAETPRLDETVRRLRRGNARDLIAAALLASGIVGCIAPLF